MKGLVTKLIGGKYTVLDLETSNSYVCIARGKLRYTKLEKESSFNVSTTNKTKVESRTIKLSPKVGDIVEYVIGNTNYIDNIYERKNSLVRPDLANIDQLFLVNSAKEPDFNYSLVDRFLVNTERNNIKTIIVVSKIDLLNELELKNLKDKLKYYEEFYDVIYTSSKDLIEIDEITSRLKNKISVFSGQTGAGKSSLLNSIDESLNLETQEISKSLNRGKHTTRYSCLYNLFDGFIADTPGFSSIDFGNIEPNEVKDCFVDFKEYSKNCKFRDCLHINEIGCTIKEKVKNKELLESRYESYQKIYEEVKNTQKRY